MSGVLSLTIRDQASLYAAYMAFIKNGGLFIPTAKTYVIGSELFLMLKMYDQVDVAPCLAKIIWITPPRARANRTLGIGIQFSELDGEIKSRIEHCLAGKLNSAQPTHCF